MPELKPAHEVIVGEIKRECANLTQVEEWIEQGGVPGRGDRGGSPLELQDGRLQHIGGLCRLLEVLEKMIVPEDALPEVIQRLKGLTYPHAAIWSAIEALEKRAKK